MADKELRKMNRTELIEIIYALQQNEQQLRAENEKLSRQLEDRTLRMEKAGSIAEAAVGLNHIFEDAENAARQYLLSIQDLNARAAEALEDAQKKKDEYLRQAEEECRGLREQTEQDIKQQRAAIVQEIQAVLKQYPELAAHIRRDVDL